MRNRMGGCGCGFLFFVLFGFGCFAPVAFVTIITVVTWADNREIAWLSQSGEIHQAIIVGKETTTQRRSVTRVLIFDVPERDIKQERDVVNDDVYRRTQVGDRVSVWVIESEARIVRSPYRVDPKFYSLLLLPCLSIFLIIVLYRRKHARWKALHAGEPQKD